jgi:hypothetical protein
MRLRHCLPFAVLTNKAASLAPRRPAQRRKIDQWYSQQNGKGVVFILNVTDPAAAHEMLEKLPLGQAHLMSFELIPLGPLAPLRRLSGIATKR